MKKIFIQKIAAVDGGSPAMPMEDYVPGTHANQKIGASLPVEYSLEGQLVSEIKVGFVVHVLRTKRNGIEAAGHFTSTPITEVTENTFKTRNSVYTYKYI